MEHHGPLPGTIIGGQYRVDRVLGSGAMGVVLLAKDDTLDRAVAIKFIHSDLLDKSFRERFVAEARAMARVSHPNLLQVHAFGEHEDVPYFVMEYVPGVTLEQWGKASGVSGVASVDAALAIIEQACEGVTAIHAANTVHRDLKPSNILLDEQNRPRVADLGLAVLCRHDGPSQKEVVGTPEYMAPEVVLGSDVDASLRPRADVYALACIAYELVAGKPPFQADTSLATMMHQVVTPVTPPSKLRPELSPLIDQAILRALEKDPSARTPTAEAFRQDLVAARTGRPEPLGILVAEDQDDFRDALEFVLKAEFRDAEIVCVANGRAALEAFDRKTPSVAIFDLQMPELDGMELTRLVRERKASVGMPIIVVTASGGPDEWKRLAAMGVDRFLVKPVVLDDVVALIRRCLAERTQSGGPTRAPL